MWLFYALTTTLLWGVAELFYKKGARPDEKYSHLKISMCVGFVMGAHAIVTLITGNIGFNPKNILIYMPVIFCYVLSMTLSYFGMRFIEESISDPIENTSGALCSLLCFLVLGDKLSMLQVTAIAVLLVGVLGIGFLDNSGTTDRKKVLGKKMAFVAFSMPFLYALFDAVGSMLEDVYLDIESTKLIDVTEDTIENVANTAYELVFFAFAIVIFIFIKAKGEKINFPRQKDKLLAAVCETAGQFTYVFAMSGGNAKISAPIMSSVCVVSFILSHIFLKERLTKKQYFFIALVIIGIIGLAIIEGE